MKKSVINEVCNGLRGMHTVKLPDGFHDDTDELAALNLLLEEKLSPELLNLHNHYVDSISKGYAKEAGLFFAEGFKLGFLMGIECSEE